LERKNEELDKKIESLRKIEKLNNNKGFVEYDVFLIQKKFLEAIDNGELTYKMIYKKDSPREGENDEDKNVI